MPPSGGLLKASRSAGGRLLNLLFLANVFNSTALSQQLPLTPSPQSQVFDKKQAIQIQLTEEEKAFLQSHPIIRFGTDETWEPFVIKGEDGILRGVDVDFLRYINETIGTNIQLVTGRWVDMVEKAKKREIDGLATSAPLKAREPYFNFSDAYVSEFMLITIRSDSSLDIKKISDLSGKTVVIQKGNEAYAALLKPYPAIKVIEADSEIESVKMVLERKADAKISSTSTYKALYKNFLQSIKIGYVATEKPLDLVYSIRKDWPELVSIMNKSLASMPQETFNSIYLRWFGFTPPHDEKAETGISLSPEETDFLKQHPTIKLAVDADWPPFEFIDQTGNYQGIAAEYMKLFEEQLGIQFEYSKDKTWAEVVEDVKQRKLDMYAAVLKTSQREKYMDFTLPYLSFPMVIVTTDKVTFVDGIKDLKHKPLAVVKGYATHEILTEEHPSLDLRLFPDISEALRAVSQGKMFAYAGNLAVISHIMRREGFTNLKISGEMPYRFDIAMAIRKDWPELTPIIQKVMDSISQEERDAILQKWITFQYEQRFDYSTIWKILSVAACILLIILYWNRKLAAEVKKRKQAEA